MRVSLIGGMDRLAPHYLKEAKKHGVELQVFNHPEANLHSKLLHAEAVILFTGKVSHQLRIQVMNTARSSDIPVYQYHSCGICTFRDCLSCLSNPSHGESLQRLTASSTH